jgi:hypothetical protein
MENLDDDTERNHMEYPDDWTERHHMENPDDGRDAFRNERHAHFEKKNGHWPWYVTPIANSMQNEKWPEI